MVTRSADNLNIGLPESKPAAACAKTTLPAGLGQADPSAVTCGCGSSLESPRHDEQRFRKIFDEGPLGMALADTDRTLIQVNATFCRMLGYTEEELIGLRIDEITHPDDLAAGLDLLGRVARGETARFQMEKRYLRKDGTAISVMVTASVLRSASGQAEHFLGMVEDITERKHAEQALRESRQRLSLALEAIRAALSHWDLRSGKLEWNARCYELLGYEPGSFTPNLDIWRSRVHPDDRGRVEASLHECAEQHKDPLSEYRIVWPSGTVRWVRAARRFTYDASGKPATCTSVLYDITDTKQAEAALREGRDRLTLAIEAAQAGTALWSLQTGELAWNARTFQILGHAPDAFRPTYERWRSQVHPDDIADTEAHFHRCVEQHRDFTHEHRIIRPSGEIRWVRLMARVNYGPDAQAVLSMAIATDITEAKHAEAQLRNAKDVAEAASHAKDQFLAVLSHELRTPLTPVSTAAQLLEADPLLSAEQQELVGMIRRNVELEARLIDDLLDLTRISRGKLTLHCSTVDVHQRIQHVIEMVQSDAAAKQQKLTVAATAQQHHVQADAARLQQVLWNLVRNAVKFTPVGGSITIRTQDAAQGRLMVAVEDTGVGIEASILPRLFNAFEQGGQDVTRQFGGLGLGLAISKGLVDLHGGTLAAHSDGHGKGATFVLQLPISAAPQAKRPRPPAIRAEIASNTGRHLLLVEDHADTAKMMARVIRSYGHEVVVADSVASGLRAAQAQKFDLLVSDIGLPDGSGLDLMRQLHSIGLKGIALSGFGMEEDVQKSHQAGFAAHLTKPVNLQTLARTIREVLA